VRDPSAGTLIDAYFHLIPFSYSPLLPFYSFALLASITFITSIMACSTLLCVAIGKRYHVDDWIYESSSPLMGCETGDRPRTLGNGFIHTLL
jgi:hypothetical protein